MKKTTSKKEQKEEPGMASEEKVAVAEGLKKTYLKNRSACRVSFFLPEEAAPGAKKIAIVGDFNGWDRNANIMKKQKDGTFLLTLELPANREYRFKYLIDDTQWENDWCADKYVPNEFGGEDSVIQV
ncbi:MAG: isoamylase early set domain-containing protein [Nitrospiraceae bacterium]|nr:isoamylase early set domain-containing protein [Nitrospiraceae bacterium]